MILFTNGSLLQIISAVSFKLSHLLARFPFLAKTGFYFSVFSGSFFRWFFCTPFGGQRVAQGGRFEALFLTFWVPFWVPHLGIVFDSFWAP